MLSSRNDFGKFPSSLIFWKSLRSGISSLMFIRIPQKPSVPGFLFVVSFLSYRFCFTSSVQSVEIFMFLLDSVLVCCMFLETCPFFLGCPVCWYTIVDSILLRFFGIFAILVVTSPVSFLILFGSSLFLLVSLARGLLILFTLSKKTQLLVDFCPPPPHF